MGVAPYAAAHALSLLTTEELVAELRRRGFDFLKEGYMIEVEKLAENRTRADLAPRPGS